MRAAVLNSPLVRMNDGDHGSMRVSPLFSRSARFTE